MPGEALHRGVTLNLHLSGPANVESVGEAAAPVGGFLLDYEEVIALPSRGME